MGSWCTPVRAQVGDRDQVILMLPKRVVAYDPDSGEIIWFCEGLRHKRGDLAYSSPVIAGDVCFVTGGYKGPSMAIAMGGSGDVSKTQRLWRKEKSPQSIGSGVFIDGYVYRPNAGPGTIQCLDPKTGDVQWTDRGSGGQHWASIVAVGGLLYATDQDGKTVVFEASPKDLQQVAVNTVGEPSNTRS